MNKYEAFAVQKQMAQRGFIAGTPEAIAELCGNILVADSRFRKVVAAYGPNKNPKPGKELGTEYRMVGSGCGPVDGTRTQAEQAARNAHNNLIMIHCVDSERRGPEGKGWRSINTNFLRFFGVFTGRKVYDASKGKMMAEQVLVPVHIIS